MVFRAIRPFGKPGFLTIAPIGSVQIAVNPTTAHDPMRLPIPSHRYFAIGAVGSGIVWSRVVAVPGVKTRARIKMGMDTGKTFGLICHDQENMRTRINCKKTCVYVFAFV